MEATQTSEDTGGLAFANAAALAAWLRAAGVPLETWGQGGAKTAADLWREVAAGETTLRDDPPRREVRVAQVFIRRGGRVLMEIEQEMTDGRRRVRDWPPSEKFKLGEDARTAAQRCLCEELGLDVRPVALCEDGRPYIRKTDSPSYPGLLTVYRVYTIALDAAVLPTAGLPDNDFWRDNSAANDPIRRHLWGWREERDPLLGARG